jgi:nucleoside-diphosphate-sugar epimerase
MLTSATLISEQTLNRLRGRRVVVTGGCGFIGSHIVDALAPAADVVVVDDLSSGDEARLPPNVGLIRADVQHPEQLVSAFEGAHTVIHTAALVSVPRSVEMPQEYHNVNASGTLNVLTAARQCGVKRVVYSASSSAYGDAPELPKIETMADVPRSPYAASKLVGELYVRSFASVYEIDGVSLRYFNIFGPRQAADSAYAGVIAAFAKALLYGNRPSIYGDGTASRDFTFVANVVRANLLAAAREKPFRGEVINIATGRAHTVTQLATRMAKLVGRDDLQPDYKFARLGDVPHSLADLSRAQQELGYEVAVDFETGLAATVEWYKQKFSA